MDTFGLVAAAPSLIIGLSISRLMLDGVTLFRSRYKAQIEWVPLAWALIIFVIQIQCLWAMIELHTATRVWTIFDFTLLLGMALCLYVAAALVIPDIELPKGEDLRGNFMKHGRWSLAALALAEVFAASIDFMIFRGEVDVIAMLLLVINISLPVLFLLCSSQKVRVGMTVLNLIAVFWGVWMESPRKY